MSELVDLISIGDRRELRCAKVATTKIDNNEYSAEDLRDALATIKQTIEEALINRRVRIHYHRQFIRAVHGRLQSGKAGSIQPVNYFRTKL